MYRKLIPVLTIQLCASFAVNSFLVILTSLIYRNHGNVSLLMIAMTIPSLLFSRVFGRFIDKSHSKKILLLLALSVLILIGILLVNPAYDWLLYGFALLAYSLDLFIRLYLQVMVTDLADSKHYLKWNSLLNVIENIGIVLGPVLGGILIQCSRADFGFLFGGILYIGTFLAIAFAREYKMPSAQSDSIPAYGGQSKRIKYIILTACVFAFAIALINVRQISFVIQHYNTGEIGYSLTESMWGLGMIVGCFLIIYLDKKMSTHRLIGNSYFLIAICMILLVVSHSYAFALASFLVLGIGNMVVSIGFTTLIQKISDKAKLGEILGIKNLWQQIVTLLAMVLSGLCETGFSSERVYLLVCAPLLVVGGVMVFNKKRFNAPLILLVSILLCTGCSKKQLPMPEYPLNQDVVQSALTEVGFSWTIASENPWGDGRTYYEIHDEEGKDIMYISSVGDEKGRVLQLSFFSSGEISTALPEEHWKNTIKLATILYGGFDDSEQVYEEFKNTYDEKARIDMVPDDSAKNRERIQWDYEINNIDCFIGLSRWHEDTDELTTELVSIVFTGKCN